MPLEHSLDNVSVGDICSKGRSDSRMICSLSRCLPPTFTSACDFELIDDTDDDDSKGAAATMFGPLRAGRREEMTPGGGGAES